MYFVDTIEITSKFIEPTFLKLFAGGAMLFSFFLGDIHTEAVIALFMLVLFDTILGIQAAFIEGNSFTSRKFVRLPIKIFVYFVGVSGAMFADTTIGVPFIQTSMIAFMGVTEFISILENMGRMGYETPKKLLNQLKDFTSNK